MGERRAVYMVLMRTREGKRQLGRPMRRWEDNIKTSSFFLRCYNFREV
jgi:hypothetical protein